MTEVKAVGINTSKIEAKDLDGPLAVSASLVQ
jgi:hypothetical protein